MNKKMITIGACCVSIVLACFTGCGHKTQQTDSAESSDTVSVEHNNITFNADSAYQYIADQVAFGARVPGSKAHKACAEWMEAKFTNWGHQVIVQNADLKAYDGTILPSKNIIVSINPQNKQRILLMAHWDTRPVADQDPDPKKRKTPILGADDGASGVGVLMEMARQYAIDKPSVGVDIVLFDSEDYGTPNDDNSWCLGSQYWAKNPHAPGYTADFGILLDMVGSKDATFFYEGYSKIYASRILNLVWDTASRLGYGKFFKQSDGGTMTDDHVPVIKELKIPCIDIINYSNENSKGFGDYWHTHEDNMNIISTETLRAVGHTVMTVIKEYK
ncbi:M28 family peptidase [Porphyromonas pogonae]|uniref:M28 family peptidase n=1 Tax=Porphyromonas pogonae TaxID=867595 RepID=UPI002E7952D4|nr:M28 family peptidase [Porphyromonas pogonae]